MFGKKKREYEARIAALINENDAMRARITEQGNHINGLIQNVNALESKNNELSKTVDDYKNRENAITQTLLEAKSVAEKIVNEANNKANAIIADAEKTLKNAKNNAENIENDAAVQADKLIYDAKEKSDAIIIDAKNISKRRINQVEASAEEYQARLDMLKGQLAEIANTTQQQISGLLGFVREIDPNQFDGKEIKDECDVMTQISDETVKDLPESYDNPNELMQSIYALQHRNVAATERNVQRPSDKNVHAKNIGKQILKNDDKSTSKLSRSDDLEAVLAELMAINNSTDTKK